MKFVAFAFLMVSTCAVQTSSTCHKVNEELASRRFYLVTQKVIRPYGNVLALTCHNVSSIFDVMYDIPNNYRKYIEIIESNVTTLPAGGFSKFPRIIWLNLSNIHIKAIEEDAFKDLDYVTELYLDGNELTELKNIFSPLRSLQLLDLSRNKIRHIDISYFVEMTKLKNTNLADNFLTEFECDLPLRYLDLSRNPLKTVRVVKTERLLLLNASTDEFKIDLSNSSTAILNLSDNKVEVLQNHFFKDFRCSNLFLRANEISKIDRDVFSPLQNLTTLDLSHNRIPKLPLGLFRKLAALQNLDLSWNLITNLTFGSFEGLNNLMTLNLSNNVLLDLEVEVLYPMVDLNGLRLDNNRISFLDANRLVDQFGSLRHISLNGNLWICEDLIALCEVFVSRKVVIKSGEYYDGKNVFGIACVPRNSSENSSEVSSQNSQVIQKAIDDDLDNSKLNRQLKGDVSNSKGCREDMFLESVNNPLFNFMAVHFAISCLFLLLMVCLMYVFLYKIYHKN